MLNKYNKYAKKGEKTNHVKCSEPQEAEKKTGRQK